VCAALDVPKVIVCCSSGLLSGGKTEKPDSHVHCLFIKVQTFSMHQMKLEHITGAWIII